MPRSSCLRSRIVKHRMGTTNSVVAAATAGQSCPPSPMMKGMKGGIVCAEPLVSSTANAYSFQAKMRQNTAVAAMPVAACGKYRLDKRLYARIAVDQRGLFVLSRNFVNEPFQEPDRQ